MPDHEEDDATQVLSQPSHAGLNRGEARVLDKLVRARVVANLLLPDQEPDLEDLIDLAELISDEGG